MMQETSGTASPVLSVVVPTRNRAALLEPCLVALRVSLRAGDELIVADSASTDPAVVQVALAHGARLVRCGWPGASRARNAGAAAAGNDVVVFVDDDVRVGRGWAGAVSAAFAADPDVTFVTTAIDAPAGQRDVQRPVAVTEVETPLLLDRRRPVLVGHGASFAVRRATFREIGGFDEALGPGTPLRAAEDQDLFDRLLASGRYGRYEPAARAEHEQWRNRWQLVALEWSYGIGTGARLARLRRSDRERGRAVAAETLWRNGVRTVPASVRAGYEFGVAFVVARLLGAGVGFIAGWPRGG